MRTRNVMVEESPEWIAEQAAKQNRSVEEVKKEIEQAVQKAAEKTQSAPVQDAAARARGEPEPKREPPKSAVDSTPSAPTSTSQTRSSTSSNVLARPPYYVVGASSSSTSTSHAPSGSVNRSAAGQSGGSAPGAGAMSGGDSRAVSANMMRQFRQAEWYWTAIQMAKQMEGDVKKAVDDLNKVKGDLQRTKAALNALLQDPAVNLDLAVAELSTLAHNLKSVKKELSSIDVDKPKQELEKLSNELSGVLNRLKSVYEENKSLFDYIASEGNWLRDAKQKLDAEYQDLLSKLQKNPNDPDLLKKIEDYNKRAEEFNKRREEFLKRLAEGQSTIDQYNQLVDQYNTLLGQYKQKADEYAPLFQRYNQLAGQYNALLEEYKKKASEYAPALDLYNKLVAKYNQYVEQYNQKLSEVKPVLDQYNFYVNTANAFRDVAERLLKPTVSITITRGDKTDYVDLSQLPDALKQAAQEGKLKVATVNTKDGKKFQFLYDERTGKYYSVGTDRKGKVWTFEVDEDLVKSYANVDTSKPPTLKEVREEISKRRAVEENPLAAALVAAGQFAVISRGIAALADLLSGRNPLEREVQYQKLVKTAFEKQPVAAWLGTGIGLGGIALGGVASLAGRGAKTVATQMGAGAAVGAGLDAAQQIAATGKIDPIQLATGAGLGALGGLMPPKALAVGAGVGAASGIAAGLQYGAASGLYTGTAVGLAAAGLSSPLLAGGRAKTLLPDLDVTGGYSPLLKHTQPVPVRERLGAKPLSDELVPEDVVGMFTKLDVAKPDKDVFNLNTLKYQLGVVKPTIEIDLSTPKFPTSYEIVPISELRIGVPKRTGAELSIEGVATGRDVAGVAQQLAYTSQFVVKPIAPKTPLTELLGGFPKALPDVARGVFEEVNLPVAKVLESPVARDIKLRTYEPFSGGGERTDFALVVPRVEPGGKNIRVDIMPISERDIPTLFKLAESLAPKVERTAPKQTGGAQQEGGFKLFGRELPLIERGLMLNIDRLRWERDFLAPLLKEEEIRDVLQPAKREEGRADLALKVERSATGASVLDRTVRALVQLGDEPITVSKVDQTTQKNLHDATGAMRVGEQDAPGVETQRSAGRALLEQTPKLELEGPVPSAPTGRDVRIRIPAVVPSLDAPIQLIPVEGERVPVPGPKIKDVYITPYISALAMERLFPFAPPTSIWAKPVVATWKGLEEANKPQVTPLYKQETFVTQTQWQISGASLPEKDAPVVTTTWPERPRLPEIRPQVKTQTYTLLLVPTLQSQRVDWIPLIDYSQIQLQGTSLDYIKPLTAVALSQLQPFATPQLTPVETRTVPIPQLTTWTATTPQPLVDITPIQVVDVIQEPRLEYVTVPYPTPLPSGWWRQLPPWMVAGGEQKSGADPVPRAGRLQIITI